MKKMLIVLLVVLTILSAGTAAVIAGPVETATGNWNYAPLTMEPPEIVGCNTFIFMTDTGTFDGTFVGTEIEDGLLTIYCNGRASYKGNLIFTGTVDGSYSGTMEMRIVGTSPDLNFWEGTWTILGGTGDLASLRGQGTWSGPPGFLAYSGNYHFEPE